MSYFWNLATNYNKKANELMKIVVTGGSGFIGSHVVDVLLKNGHDVLIYDFVPPRCNQPCRSVEADVNNMPKLVSSTKGYDVIYHMAAEANVNRFYEMPLTSNINTSNSTLSVLECAKINGISRVLLSSTEWVYGIIEGKEDMQITVQK